MRAILIDAYNQQMDEIDLPINVSAFQEKLRTLLKTDQPKIIHSNEVLTVIFDEDAIWKDTPAFWSGLIVDVPMFGNVICVGRHPVTKELEDLCEFYEFGSFNVKWCDVDAVLHYRKVVREFAKSNRT